MHAQVACRSGYEQLLTQLLQCRALNINARDRVDYTPLMLACKHGRLQCVKVLLQQHCLDVLLVDGVHFLLIYAAVVSAAQVPPMRKSRDPINYSGECIRAAQRVHGILTVHPA